jgi:4-amino-4-deoxy-L-arabinose transferase-like glycosyltransferase
MMYKILNTFTPSSLPRRIPPLNPQFCVNAQAHPNLFTHTNLRIFEVWKNDWGLVIIRIYSALLGLAVIYATYRIGCILDKNGGWLGIAAAGWVAFLPQFTFVNSNVRSDTLANAIAALLFLLAVVMQTSNAQTNKLALGMGILLGLGLLSKYTFVYIIPIGLLTVILVNPSSPRIWLKPLTLVMLPTILIIAAYYLTFAEARAALTYTITTPSKMKVRPDLFTFEYLKQASDDLLIGFFFARFGWLNVQVPTSFSRIAFGLWGVGTTITLAQLWRQRDNRKTTPSLKIIFLLSIIIMFAIVGLLLSIYRTGERHLFPTLAAWSCLGVWGWWQILSTRGRAILTLAAGGFMLAFNLYALFFALVPAYYK